MLPSSWTTPSTAAALNRTRMVNHIANSQPSPAAWFRALEYFRPDETRVVILGQDPYHTRGKACGLAFGIDKEWAASGGRVLYSSFGNVWREATGRTEINSEETELEQWAKQGVLLLNTQLTVEVGKPLSHSGVWDEVVGAILKQVPANVVWLAWGVPAREVAEKYIRNGQLIATSHPSKYSATRGRVPFVGSDCFNLANEYLVGKGREAIDWGRNVREVHNSSEFDDRSCPW